jgi:hypothetical protein
MIEFVCACCAKLCVRVCVACVCLFASASFRSVTTLVWSLTASPPVLPTQGLLRTATEFCLPWTRKSCRAGAAALRSSVGHRLLSPAPPTLQELLRKGAEFWFPMKIKSSSRQPLRSAIVVFRLLFYSLSSCMSFSERAPAPNFVCVVKLVDWKKH